MVEISDCTEKCFAVWMDGCMIQTERWQECSPQCPFYKPQGCEDWIRREKDNEVWLIPPEEYYAKFAENQKRNGSWKL